MTVTFKKVSLRLGDAENRNAAFPLIRTMMTPLQNNTTGRMGRTLRWNDVLITREKDEVDF